MIRTRTRISRSDKHGDSIVISMGGVEYVMKTRAAADLAAEIQHCVVELVNGSLQAACDRKDQTTWRQRAVAELRAREIRGSEGGQNFLAMVLKTPPGMRGDHLKDVKEGNDALDFTSDREIELLVKEHGLEVEGSR